MSWCPGGDKLDQDIFDAVADFFGQIVQRGEQLAERHGVPVSCIKAMHRVEGAVTMKDLGQRLRCDPSFVTMIADLLEQRGLARREANTADRRIKNLVLTDRGIEVKATLERELLGQMPWSHALDRREREQLLALIRKMSSAMEAATGSTGSPSAGDEEVSSTVLATSPVAP